MSLSKAEIARLLGMKEREVIAVRTHRDGYVVTTHDHQQVVLDVSGAPAPAEEPLQLTAEQKRKAAAAEAADAKRKAAAARKEAETAVKVTEADTTADGAQILEWVGDNPERASYCHAAESRAAKPRTELLEELGRLAGDDDGDADA